jgi:hypothetical protein
VRVGHPQTPLNQLSPTTAPAAPNKANRPPLPHRAGGPARSIAWESSPALHVSYLRPLNTSIRNLALQSTRIKPNRMLVPAAGLTAAHEPRGGPCTKPPPPLNVACKRHQVHRGVAASAPCACWAHLRSLIEEVICEGSCLRLAILSIADVGTGKLYKRASGHLQDLNSYLCRVDTSHRNTDFQGDGVRRVAQQI